MGGAQAQLAGQLRAMDNELSMLSHGPEQLNGEIVDYLNIIHRKIDLIGRYLIADSHQLNEKRPISVNISEQGMSFYADSALRPESHLVMSVTLFPSYESFFSYGKVVRCDPMDESIFIVGLQFVDDSIATGKLLARHVLQVQQAQKRKELESRSIIGH